MNENIRNMINKVNEINKSLNENSRRNYLLWKKKNVTLRGIKEHGEENGIYGSFGKGLYTVPLSNKSMAKQYGEVKFVVNAIPSRPKIVQTLNDAEILRQNLIYYFCHFLDHDYDTNYFESLTSMEEEMIKRGYNGLIIKGREIVHYIPENILYFSTESQLENYFNHVIEKNNTK